jgi:tetratricopeptide (TPR) repeat protein
MVTVVKRIACTALTALSLCAMTIAQSTPSKSNGSQLRQHYASAQRLQLSGNLDAAIGEYRAFLMTAQKELALGHAGIGDAAGARALFQGAVAVEPESWDLRIEFANTALALGDPAQAENQTRSVIAGVDGDAQTLAEAHQVLGRALLKENRDQDAKKEMEEAIRLDPTFANDYGLAVVCLDLDDEKCATQKFEDMERLFGDTPAIHMQFGLAYGNSDFVPQAIAEFRKTIEENPRLPGAHYALAAALLAAGDDAKNVPEAEAELKKELEVSPRDSLTYAALGKLSVSAHKYGEAESYLKHAAVLNPANPDAFLYLGQMDFDTNRIADAETALRKAIELTRDPSRNRYQIQKAHFLLGRILMQEHKPEEAHAEMAIAQSFANKGLSHDKNELAGLLSNSAATGTADPSPETYSREETVMKNGNSSTKNDLSVFEKQLTPAIADSYNNLGVIAASGRNYAEALENFEQAAHWQPTLEGLDLNWGRAAFMASKFDEAIAPLTRYIHSHPQDSGVRGALAMSEFMTRDYAGCVATFKAAEKELATIPQMEYVYAESLVKTGEVTAGKNGLESLESAHPEIGDVHRSLGEVYETLGDRLRAARELHTAIVLNTNDPEAHFDLGRVDVESGDAAAAIPELEMATKLTPENPLIHRELAVAYGMASRKDDEARELEIYNNLKHPPDSTIKPAADLAEKETGK